jgi:hypothetical protein
MQLILESMLNVILEIFWDIVSVGDISDSSHGHCAHKLVGETWQLSFEKSNNMAV